jgi:hypothetical protein
MKRWPTPQTADTIHTIRETVIEAELVARLDPALQRILRPAPTPERPAA